MGRPITEDLDLVVGELFRHIFIIKDSVGNPIYDDLTSATAKFEAVDESGTSITQLTFAEGDSGVTVSSGGVISITGSSLISTAVSNGKYSLSMSIGGLANEYTVYKQGNVTIRDSQIS